MESLTINILNPKAKGLLQSLEDLNLIAISQSKPDLTKLLDTLRTDNQMSLEEITEEVESVRTARNA